MTLKSPATLLLRGFKFYVRLNNFRIFAFTHKTIDIREIGRFHIEDEQLEKRLLPLKKKSGIAELLYLSTCNRVELMLHSPEKPSPVWLHNFFKNFNPAWTKKEITWAEEKVKIYEGEDAVKHLFYVASSVDSLVVGEREIITQVRKAYEVCSQLNLSSDFIRLLVKTTIETAKKIYSDTQIAQRPVSVVSLASRKLQEAGIKKSSRLLFIGAGQTNTSIAQYLKKESLGSVHVFNRSIENAEKLAGNFSNSKAHTLDKLKKHSSGFDVLISCTSSAETIVDTKLFSVLVAGEKGKKIIVDLAVPADVEHAVAKLNNVQYIGIDSLKTIARENLEHRQKELERCNKIIDSALTDFRKKMREREVEIAMKTLPGLLKEIRENATSKVFSKEVESLDSNSKEVLKKILDYMEGKYISVPMKITKNILVKNE